MHSDYIPAFTLEPAHREPAVIPSTGRSTPSFINDVAAGRVELPTVPGLVQQLIAEVSDPAVDLRSISQSLSRDPVMSAKVLRLANSAFFGGQGSMASIETAVSRIGVQALEKLIAACGLASAFSEVRGIELQVFWQDSLVAAIAATDFARRIGADPKEAYTAGLLHATGHLILCQAYPEIAEVMFGGFEVVRGAELAAIELGAFGIDHSEVGALWVEALGFPKPVVEAIRDTLRPESGQDSPLAQAVRNACLLAGSVALNETVDVALCCLASSVQQRCRSSKGDVDPTFTALYNSLCQADLSL